MGWKCREPGCGHEDNYGCCESLDDGNDVFVHNCVSFPILKRPG